MQLSRLAVENFRNLTLSDLTFHPRFNLIEGQNGQGKTNLLEAIYLLATLRSFRETRIKHLVRYDEENAWVRGDVLRGDLTRQMGVEIGGEGKRAAIDGQVVARLGDYFGHLHVVMFGPEDLQLTKGSAAHRRRFLDRAIFNVCPSYLEEARRYLTALRHRNDLLRRPDMASGDPHLMATFDQQLVELGARVLHRRLSFLAEFVPLFQQAFARLAGQDGEVSVRYQGLADLGTSPDDVPPEESLAATFLERLHGTRGADERRGHTTQGPHADDLELTMDGHPVRHHASQGQHRTFSLALKIAEMDRATRMLGACPVLLLDDVSSELDGARNAQLMGFFDQAGGQVFVTTTHRQYIQTTAPAQILRVHDGQVEPEG